MMAQIQLALCGSATPGRTSLNAWIAEDIEALKVGVRSTAIMQATRQSLLTERAAVNSLMPRFASG